MRTTVEIPNALRARLLELAARRREKDFSNLVREALEAYLAGAEARDEARRSAIQVLGTVSDDDADRMVASARHARGKG